MSTPTDLESRLTAALAARAEQVTVQDLRHAGPPVVPLRRRTTPLLLVAAAACVLLAVVLAVVRPGDDRVSPAPEPKGPEVVVPRDVGRDWGPAQMSPPFAIDLDGDGRQEEVRFRADRDRPEDGRVRLETSLTSDGSEVFGVVDLGFAGGVTPLEPIDLDRDGDQELVLYRTPADDAMATVPVVLELAGGVLVEAPASDPALLRMGNVVVEDGELYDMVHVADYWIEGGELHSLRSVRTFASVGMELMRPEEYEAEAFTWRLGEDDVLRPEASDVPCMRMVPEGRRPCRPGEGDDLPVLAPVADGTVGVGGSFSPDTGGFRFTASLEPAAEDGADADLVVTVGSGESLRTPLRTGSQPLLFTTQPTRLFYDGASVVVASGDGDEPIAHQVLVQGRDGMVVLEPVGDVPLGTGYTDDARAFRTWLTEDGDLVTAVARTADETGEWDVHRWALVDRRSMVAAPLDTVCFDDPGDPATVRRC